MRRGRGLLTDNVRDYACLSQLQHTGQHFSGYRGGAGFPNGLFQLRCRISLQIYTFRNFCFSFGLGRRPSRHCSQRASVDRHGCRAGHNTLACHFGKQVSARGFDAIRCTTLAACYWGALGAVRGHRDVAKVRLALMGSDIAPEPTDSENPPPNTTRPILRAQAAPVPNSKLAAPERCLDPLVGMISVFGSAAMLHISLLPTHRLTNEPCKPDR